MTDVKLLSCPFCASADIDPEGWASAEGSRPTCNHCGGSADTIELWNRRRFAEHGVFAVWSPNMATAVMAINKLCCAEVLLHFVPDTARSGSYWLVFRDDIEIKQRWKENFPRAEILPRPELP